MCAWAVRSGYVMYVYIFINTHWVTFWVVAIVDVYSSDRVWLKIKCVSGSEDYLTDFFLNYIICRYEIFYINHFEYSNDSFFCM